MAGAFERATSLNLVGQAAWRVHAQRQDVARAQVVFKNEAEALPRDGAVILGLGL